MTEYLIGEVARLAHVSVRTLHHYDGIGLLTPSARSAAGYRLYSAEDLRSLQQILFYRELGFALDEIADILADRPPGRTTTCAGSTGCCVSGAPAMRRCSPRSNEKWRQGRWVCR